MPQFEVELTVFCTIEIAQSVLDGVLTDEWRAQFYALTTPQDVADHLAYNMVVHRAGLSQLDGFADHPDRDARVFGEEWV